MDENQGGMRCAGDGIREEESFCRSAGAANRRRVEGGGCGFSGREGEERRVFDDRSWGERWGERRRSKQQQQRAAGLSSGIKTESIVLLQFQEEVEEEEQQQERIKDGRGTEQAASPAASPASLAVKPVICAQCASSACRRCRRETEQSKSGAARAAGATSSNQQQQERERGARLLAACQSWQRPSARRQRPRESHGKSLRRAAL